MLLALTVSLAGQALANTQWMLEKAQNIATLIKNNRKVQVGIVVSVVAIALIRYGMIKMRQRLERTTLLAIAFLEDPEYVIRLEQDLKSTDPAVRAAAEQWFAMLSKDFSKV